MENGKKENSEWNLKELSSINGNELMALEFDELHYAIEQILPSGIFLLAGSPKIGKSWLALQICLAVATGGQLWDYSAFSGEVVYFALEDNYRRLQRRLHTLEADKLDISKLHLVTASFGINDGLIEQTDSFIDKHTGTNLVIVDTLQHIRNSEFDKNMYAYDYRDMTKLREITDKHDITLLLVHHTRKMYDPDPLNTISGSTGLVGAVDGVFVLEKTQRSSSSGKLTIANRDTEDYCFEMNFDQENCQWLLVSKDGGLNPEEAICVLIDDFLNGSWSGTATELTTELKTLDGDSDLSALTVTKHLKKFVGLFKTKYGIDVGFERTRNSRIITLTRSSSFV